MQSKALTHCMLVGAIIIVCAAVYFAGKTNRAPSSYVITVYSNLEHCQKDGREPAYCSELEDNAQQSVKTMLWGFKDEEDCIDAYGAEQCAVNDDNTVYVIQAGFTPFSKDSEDMRSAIPVFKSSVHPGLYLPNGYPVVLGVNTMLPEVLSQGPWLAVRARSLNSELCVDVGGQDVCAPTHTFVRGLTLGWNVAKALFAQN